MKSLVLFKDSKYLFKKILFFEKLSIYSENDFY